MPNTTTIYLMRHGHVDNPQHLFYGPEFPLSEQGKRNIRELVDDMKQAGLSPMRILSSPFTRTRQTADIAAEMFGIPAIETDERLREWDAGPWFDKPLSEFYAATGYHQIPPRIDDPRVESLDHMADRVISVLHDVVKNSDDGSLLIVSHREPLVSSLLRLQHLPWNGIHNVAFPVASVWEVTFNARGTFQEARKRFDRHVA